MDIHSLRYFMVVAQTLNITRAAEQLFVSRQALSRAIHDLEKECGSDLFVHGSGRIALTATGRDLLEKTIPLVEQFDELQTGLDIQSKKKPARIRIAIGLGTMNTLSPAVFVDFRRNFPQIDLLLMEICDDEVRKVLDSNEADLGILNTIPGRIANYEHRLIQPGQFCLQVSTGNRLSHKTVLTPMDLHNQPLVTLGDRCDMHVVLMERCRAAGSTPKIILETIDSNVANQMVRSNTAISLASNFTEANAELKVIPIDLGDLGWGVYAVHQKGEHPSHATRLLLDAFSR